MMRSAPPRHCSEDLSVSLGSCMEYYKNLPPQYTLGSTMMTRSVDNHSPPMMILSDYDDSGGEVESTKEDPLLLTRHASSKSLVSTSTQEAGFLLMPPALQKQMSKKSMTASPKREHHPVVPKKPTIAVPFLKRNRTEGSELPTVATFVEPTPAVMDRILVAVRVRPLARHERPNRLTRSQYPRAWELGDSTLTLKDASSRTPTAVNVDVVLDDTATTAQVYQAMAPTVQAVLTGKHATVFAYGQTGSGKTFTMQGESVEVASAGIIQMAASDLFERIAKTDREFDVRAQYFEIYNELIRDLLDNEAEEVSRSRSNKRPAVASLPIHDDEMGQPTVDAHEEVVKCVEDVVRLLERGNQNRAIGSTSVNEHSSRSHAIFRLILSSRANGMIRASTLNLVDLAGSETSNSSGTSGIRRREGSKINQSLLSLSRVIHSLSLPEDKRPKHIGYRDSKLTRILQPHLSGNACMAVLCCVSISRLHVEETKSTLNFAARAKEVEMKPVVNEVIDQAALVEKLQKELEETKQALRDMEQSAHRRLSVHSELAVDLPSIVLSPPPSPKPPKNRGQAVDESFRTATTDRNSSDASSEAVVANGLDDLGFAKSQAINYSNSYSYVGSVVPVKEVVIMRESAVQPDDDTVVQLEDAKARSTFLEQKLEATDDLVDTLFRDLEATRRRNKELEDLNAHLESLLTQKNSAALERFQRQAENPVTLMKYSFYLTVAFNMTGQTELCLATAMFLWLSLESNS